MLRPQDPSSRPARGTGDLLVTGATSAVGWRLCRALGERRIRYRALVRPGEAARALDGCGAWIVEGDLIDPASLVVPLDGVTRLVHLAPPDRTPPGIDGVGISPDGRGPPPLRWLAVPAVLAPDCEPGRTLLQQARRRFALARDPLPP